MKTTTLHYICLLILLIVCITGCNTTSDPKEPSEGLSYELVESNSQDSYYVVTGIGSCEDKYLVIPSTFNGLYVKEISREAFKNCDNLTNIIIPNSVTTIGRNAFDGCTGLTSITVQEGNSKYHSAGNCLIETARKELILGCKTSVIPTDNSVTSIGSFAFSGYTGLTSISIPDSVTKIGNSAFEGCTRLTSISIPDSVTSIRNYVFKDCTGLTSISIPDSVTSIGSFAFSGCTGLTSISIPDSVTSIDKYAFEGCTGLTSITVQEGNSNYHSAGNCLIETASKELILGCKTSVIPTDNSVTNIGYGAFDNCSGLTSISIPDSVTSIGHCAFKGCTSLTSITIPDSVEIIYNCAFKGCTSLTSITYTGTVNQWENIRKNRHCLDDTPSFIIHCTDGTINQ